MRPAFQVWVSVDFNSATAASVTAEPTVTPLASIRQSAYNTRIKPVVDRAVAGALLAAQPDQLGEELRREARRATGSRE